MASRYGQGAGRHQAPRYLGGGSRLPRPHCQEQVGLAMLPRARRRDQVPLPHRRPWILAASRGGLLRVLRSHRVHQGALRSAPHSRHARPGDQLPRRVLGLSGGRRTQPGVHAAAQHEAAAPSPSDCSRPSTVCESPGTNGTRSSTVSSSAAASPAASPSPASTGSARPTAASPSPLSMSMTSSTPPRPRSCWIG